MPRARRYDTDDVRASLVRTFLERGFATASLVDLEQESALNRRQLYNDFGDKKALLLHALNDFAVKAGERFLARLELGRAGTEDITTTLLDMVELVDSPQGRLGCLVCNTAREPIARDPDVATAINDYFRRIEQAYATALERAESMGELRPGLDMRALARFYLAVHISLCVMARAGEPQEVIADATAVALQQLN